MTFVARSFGVALVALASVIVADAARAATATQKCQVAKLHAAGKEVRAKMICYAKAKKAATDVDSTCLMNAKTKADGTINRADGACPGTATDIDAAIDNCLSAFLSDDPGNGLCPAATARVLGKAAKGELACQAKDVTTPGSFGTCDTKEDEKTTAGLGRAGGSTPCVNVTSVMTDIDNCDTVIAALVTTTTTTTSASTTTTSTTLVGCAACGPCNSCTNSICATESASCGLQHAGPDVCIDLDSCSGTGCASDSDCPAGFGELCVTVCGFGCESFCCSSCSFTCGSSPAPTCGGTCPTGEICGQVSGGNSCECVTADNTCGISQAPECGGTCPNPSCCPGGQMCQASGGNLCACVCSGLPCPFATAWGSTGSGDGQFNRPQRVAVDGSGNVFVTDTACCGGNTRIQKFDNTGAFLTKWGKAGTGDGQFDGPIGIAVDGSGNVFVADTNNNRIQKFDNTGGFLTKWGSAGTGDGQFNVPIDLAVDGSGNVFVADNHNNRIQKFTSTGTFLTQWSVFDPAGVAVEVSSGNVLVVSGAQSVKKFDNVGTFLTEWSASGNGGIAVDGDGNVFVAAVNSIEVFTDTGTVVTMWGCPGNGEAQFQDALGVAVDGSRNVFVADSGNDRIQKFACP